MLASPAGSGRLRTLALSGVRSEAAEKHPAWQSLPALRRMSLLMALHEEDPETRWPRETSVTALRQLSVGTYSARMWHELSALHSMQTLQVRHFFTGGCLTSHANPVFQASGFGFIVKMTRKAVHILSIVPRPSQHPVAGHCKHNQLERCAAHRPHQAGGFAATARRAPWP